MKILYRYLGREMIWPFLFGVAAFSSIFFAGQYLLKLTSQVLQGTPVFVAMELLALYLPSVVVYTLPMSALLAVLIAFSRLSNDSEVVALYAGGVSLYKAMIPVMALGVIVSGIGFGMSEFIVPASNRASNEIQARVVREEISTDRPFAIIDRDTNTLVYVRGGYNAKTRTMRDVTITRYNGNAPQSLFHANKAHWEGGYNWILTDGSWHSFSSSGSEASGTFSGLASKPIKLHQTPKDIAMRQLGPNEMSFRELRGYIGKLRGSGVLPKDLLEFEVELYNKLAIPFAALVFAMIGAPLAVKPQRASASVGIGLSILIIFMYWFSLQAHPAYRPAPSLSLEAR